MIVHCVRICHCLPFQKTSLLYPFKNDAVKAFFGGNIVFLRHIMVLLDNAKIDYIYCNSDELNIFSLVCIRPNFDHANYLHSLFWEDMMIQ